MQPGREVLVEMLNALQTSEPTAVKGFDFGDF